MTVIILVKLIIKTKLQESDRKIVQASNEDKDTTLQMDKLIKNQILKFKPAKKRKRLNVSKTNKLVISGPNQPRSPQEDPVEVSLKSLFEPAEAPNNDPVAAAMASADINPEGKIGRLVTKSEPFTAEQNSNRKPTRQENSLYIICLLYTSPSPRDRQKSRMPSSA